MGLPQSRTSSSASSWRCSATSSARSNRMPARSRSATALPQVPSSKVLRLAATARSTSSDPLRRAPSPAPHRLPDVVSNVSPDRASTQAPSMYICQFAAIADERSRRGSRLRDSQPVRCSAARCSRFDSDVRLNMKPHPPESLQRLADICPTQTDPTPTASAPSGGGWTDRLTIRAA